MKRKIILAVITALLALCLAGCMGITSLGNAVFEDGEMVSSVLIRDERSGEVTKLTDGDSIEKVISAINDTICLRSSGGVEASDSGKEVRYVISINPAGDDISLEDELLFVYSESEFHAGEYDYKAISGGIGDFLDEYM